MNPNLFEKLEQQLFKFYHLCHSGFVLIARRASALIGKISYLTVKDDFILEDWNQTVQQAVSDYGDIVQIWEIWNEPILPANFKGYFNGSASTYTDLLKVAYQTIHSSSPGATVIGFGGLQLYSSVDPDPFNTWVLQGLKLRS